MTEDEKKIHNDILNRILRVRWPQDCEYAVDENGKPADLTNYDLIWRGVGGKIAGKDYTEEGFYDFVMELRAKDLLVKKGFVVDPRRSIPHLDKFPGVDSVQKWFRYVKTHTTSPADMTVLNELGAYLQINKIKDNSSAATEEADEVRQQRLDKKNENPIKGAVKIVEYVETTDAKTGEVVKRAVVKDVKTAGKPRDYSRFSPQLQAAFKSLDNLTPEDVGSVQQKGGVDVWGRFSPESGWSSREQLDKFLKRVWVEVNQKIRSRATEKEVIDYVVEEIRNFTDRGIK